MRFVIFSKSSCNICLLDDDVELPFYIMHFPDPSRFLLKFLCLSSRFWMSGSFRNFSERLKNFILEVVVNNFLYLGGILNLRLYLNNFLNVDISLTFLVTIYKSMKYVHIYNVKINSLFNIVDFLGKNFY